MNLLKISKFLLYLVPLSLIWVYQGTVFPFIVGKYVFFRAVVGLSAILYLWHWSGAIAPARKNAEEKRGITQKENKFVILWRQPLVIAVLLFAFIYTLAGFFGVNPTGSFWSNFERGEGSLQVIFLAMFFVLLGLNFKDWESWRKLIVVSIWSGILVIAYGVLAAMGFGNFVGGSLCSRFSGSLGNPAYTGTFLIFAIFYALYLFVEDFKKDKKWLWLGLAVMFFVFLLLTQTRGALLGLGAAIIAGLVYVFFVLQKGIVKNYVLSLIILLVIGGFVAVKYRNHIDLMPFCGAQGGNRIIDISFEAESYKTRLLLWKQSLEAFKERPILGWGPENFTIAFEKYYDTRHYDAAMRSTTGQKYSQVWYDRAHNIFFDYLIFSGILGLLSFLSIFGVYYWQFFKSKKNIFDNNLKTINYQSIVANSLLFALPIAYLVQGLVLFDVLSIYINLFMFLAFANWKFNNFNK